MKNAKKTLLGLIVLCSLRLGYAQEITVEEEILNKTEDAVAAFLAQNENESAARASCVLAVQINATNVPFTINTAGIYCVVEPIALSRAGATLITINANNVILDLNSQTISGFGNNVIASNNTGINNNNSNFQNGFQNNTFANIPTNISTTPNAFTFPSSSANIGNFQNNAANISQGSNSSSTGNATNIGSVSGVGLSVNGIQVNARNNVTIQNGALINFSSNGIFLAPGCQQIQIKNVFLFNNNVGISANGISRSTITNCFAALCRSTGFSITSGGSFTSQNSTINNCLSFGTGINSATAGTGFLFANSSNFLISQCIAYGNRGTGFQQTACTGFVYEDCISSGNINNGHGFSIENNNTSLESCIADNNVFDGFRFNCNQVSVENCLTKNNRNGYNFEGGTDGVVLNNIAQSNNAAGFTFGANTRAYQVRSNTSTGNTTFGFNNSATLAPLNKFYANYANNNGTNFNGITNFFVSPVPADAINFTTNIAE